MHETFRYDPVNQKQQSALNALNGAFTIMEWLIRRYVPYGERHRFALKSLEESSMWSNKGVAKDWKESAIDETASNTRRDGRHSLSRP